MPTYKQIEDIKARHPGQIVLFGDRNAYFLFGEDAERAAPILGLGLIPYQRGIMTTQFDRSELETRAAKLIAAGHVVAVCEQGTWWL